VSWLSHPLWFALLLPHLGWKHCKNLCSWLARKDTSYFLASQRGEASEKPTSHAGKGRFRRGAEQAVWRDEKAAAPAVVRCNLASLESVVPIGGLKWFPNEGCCCHYSNFYGHFNSACLVCLHTWQK